MALSHGLVARQTLHMDSLSTGVPLADRYLLIERLGAGGMSVVWRSFDDVLGRPVAVKVLASPIAADPVFRALIQREARAAARLAHPHITHVYDYGEAEMADGHTVPYVVMELLDGQPLIDRLREGPLPWREAVKVCADVADALAAAHRRGIVHRDIAPANIMLTQTGAKILDFGIAALAGGRGDPEGGTLLGTPAYVAPERLDDAPAAPAADVYGLGALLYETLSGTPPLPARTWQALVEAYRDGVAIAPLAVPGLPDGVADLCQRCLARDPAARPGAAEISRRLVAALSPPAPAPGMPAPAPAGALDPAPALAATRPIGDEPQRQVLAAAEPARAAAAQTWTVPLARSYAGAARAGLAGGLVLAVLTLLGLALLNRDRPQQPDPAAHRPTSIAPPAAATPSAAAAPSVSAPPSGGPSLAPSNPAARTGPSIARPATPPTQVVQALLDEVAAGQQAGRIRPDAALDLTNVLHNLQHTLTVGQPVDLNAQAVFIRTKITDRQREGAIDAQLATQLLSTVEDLAAT